MRNSERLKALLASIDAEFSRDTSQYFLGKVYGRLSEIIKDVEKEEQAFSNLSALFLKHKPEVLTAVSETISDVMSGKNLKEES